MHNHRLINRQPQWSYFYRWPVDRPVDRQQNLLLSWLPTASFWSPIKWGSLGLFYTRFQEGFKASFSHLLEVFSTCFRANISISKGEIFKSVFKRDFFSFSQLYLVFLTQTWAFHCYINPLGSLLWELFLWSREVITIFHSCIVRSCRGCDLDGESFVVIKWSDH